MSVDWNFNSPTVKRFLGKNVDRAKESYTKVKTKAVSDLKKKYLYANIKEFEFWINIDPSTGQATLDSVNYIGDGTGNLYNLNNTQKSYGWDVTSNVFKYKYKSAL